jgi:hypothetical protein
MNPQVTLALLAKFTSLAREDAEKIAKELALATQPTDYKDAEALVDRLVNEAKTKR